jgi:hypothetical protein
MELSFRTVFDVDFISLVEIEDSSFFTNDNTFRRHQVLNSYDLSRMISCMGIETVVMGLLTTF